MQDIWDWHDHDMSGGWVIYLNHQRLGYVPLTHWEKEYKPLIIDADILLTEELIDKIEKRFPKLVIYKDKQ